MTKPQKIEKCTQSNYANPPIDTLAMIYRGYISTKPKTVHCISSVINFIIIA